MFYTLNLRGKNTGDIIPITCIGEANLQYRIEEAQNIDCVDIVGVQTNEQLTSDMQQFCKEHGASIQFGQRRSNQHGT